MPTNKYQQHYKIMLFGKFNGLITRKKIMKPII